MAFKRRVINLQFSKNDKTLTLNGLRCSAVISNYGGLDGCARLQLKAYGMTLAQMNEYSSVGTALVQLGDVSLSVMAGTEDGPMAQIFQGFLIASYIETAGSPEIAFTAAAQSGYNIKGLPAASNSFKGAKNAEDIIQSLAQSAGLNFVNKGGAHGVVQNQNLSGSILDQIQKVAKAAALPVIVENGTVTIWPNDGKRDNIVIDLGPDNGLVGYPSYYTSGFIVKSEYNPLMVIGRTVNLRSSIPKANGQFGIMTSTHELSTMQPDGPWFTTCMLAPPPYVSPN